MDHKTLIATRAAQELQSGYLVNLGIGLPTRVANHLPPHIDVFLMVPGMGGLVLLEVAPDVRVDHGVESTAAELIINGGVPVMPVAA